MLDKLFFVFLVLNATGLFRFIAPQFGVEIADVSLALLVLNGFYLIARWRYLARLFRRTDMKYWLFLLGLWPLVTVLYAPSLEIREIGLQFYYVSLLCGAVVYTITNGLPAMHRVMTVSLAITVLGVALSMIAPEYFQEVALLANARISYADRAFGFFLQPNALATSLALLFIAWFSLWKSKAFLLEVPAIVVFLAAAFLTGSRSGVLVGVIIIALILAYSWRRQRRSFLAFTRFHLKILLLGVCLVGGLLWANTYISSVYYREGSLLDRVSMVTRFRLFDIGAVLEDTSLQQRLGAQMVYWSLIKAKPLFGHGLGAEAYYFESGPIYLTSHSTLLACAMEYGILYPAVFALLMLRLYMNRNRADLETMWKTNSILQFVFITLLLFIVNGGLFDNRLFYVVWGMLFAAVYCPGYVSHYRKAAGRINSWLVRKRPVSTRFARKRRTHPLGDESAIPKLSEEAGSR